MQTAPTSIFSNGDSSILASPANREDGFQTARPQTVATRVLLVDDDESEWIITRDLLREVEENGAISESVPLFSFDLEWVSSYEAGLKAIGRAAHDVYLIDYNLGARYGLDLVREAVASGVKAPLILVTGQGDSGIDIQAMRAGAADYLLKDGLDASSLERSIRYAIAQKRTEEALREIAAQNELLSAAVKNANIGILISVVRQGNEGQNEICVTFVSPAFEKITGYAPDEILGRDPRFLRGAGTDAAAIHSVESILASGQDFDGVLLHYRKDGTPFWNALKLSPVRDGRGEVIAWISFSSDVSSQIEAQQALRESRENLEAAQKMTHLGSWILPCVAAGSNQSSSRENAVIWSEEVFRILGLESSCTQPSRALDLSVVHPDDLHIAASLEETVETGATYDAQYRVRRSDGALRWVRVRAAMERDEKDNSRRIVGTMLDITEFKEAEELARQSQLRLQSVIENAPVVLWSIDAHGTITFIGGHALESSSAPNRDSYGNSIFELNEADSPMAALARRALAGEEAGAVLRANEKFFDTKYVPLRNERGDVTGAVGVAYDISERRIAENAFRESEARLRTVLENSPLVIWAIDQDGIITLSQGRALQKMGHQQNDAIGRSIFEIYGEKSAIGQIARRALAGEASQVILEVKDQIFDVSYSPSRDQNGAINGVMGVAHDVTERVRVRRELEHSEARFKRVVANAPGMVYQFRRTLSGRMEFLYASDGCREIFGIEPEELCLNAAILPEMMHEDDLENFYQSVFESENQLTPWKFECRILRRDGETRWINAQARPTREADGSTLWDGLVIDNTQNRGAQEEVLRSRRALDEAQSLAHIGSFQWNLANSEVKLSDEMFRIFGFEPGAFTPEHESIFRFLSPAERNHVSQEARAAMQEDRPASIIVRIQRRDGEMRVLQTHLRIETDADGRATHILGSAQDITESEAARRALIESEQRYSLAAQGANDGLWDWKLETDRIYYSPRWKMMLGYQADALEADPQEWFGRVHEEDIDRLRSALAAHLSGETPHFECEYRMKCASGEERWMLSRALAVTGESGTAHRITGSQTDITERKAAETQLSRDAFYDKLTGLPNRALFLDRLNRTLTRAQRNAEYAFAVLFLDIDRFKKINDSLGHLPGDQLLIEAAARFEKCLRPGDTVARLGGDEFALLVDDIRDPNDVTVVAGRIQKELERPFVLSGKEVFVTVSIGIAPHRGAEETAADLLRNADAAMYRAKGLGRARHEIFDAAMHQRAVKLLELETDLWRAIERGELCLHFQPIVSLQSGRICGFEALVRWNHPQRGLVSPGEFIPLAEENGLIIPIGWWVLEEACVQAQLWNQALSTKNQADSTKNEGFKPRFVSVNLSSKQFSQSDMIGRVQEIVARTGFDPHLLTLEITESVIMENTESASAMLLQLKAMGIQLSMDDFGTGYSSLSYLHRFSLDTLKIDRSFISQMEESQNGGEIVPTILALASGMKMKVVAEGVETSEQLGRLRAMNCGYAQGFFFAKPLPHADVQALLETEPRW